jgi:hypothetical protein
LAPYRFVKLIGDDRAGLGDAQMRRAILGLLVRASDEQAEPDEVD